MTIAGAFATVEGGIARVGLFADARVTFQDGAHRDGERKLRSLSAHVCATAAGSAATFVAAAEEVERSLPRDAGLWVASSALFANVLRKRATRAEQAPLTILVVGFLSSGHAALAVARFDGPRSVELHLYAPAEDEIVCQVAGHPVGARRVAEAVRVSFTRNDNFHSMVGVLRDQLVAGLVGVGGGLALGVCDAGKEFQFPVVRVADEIYNTWPAHVSRGQRLESSLDSALSASLAQEDSRHPLFTGGAPLVSWLATDTLCMGLPTLFQGPEPDFFSGLASIAGLLWVGKASEVRGTGAHVRYAPLLEENGTRSGLHPREKIAIESHRRGSPVPPPLAVGPTTPPSSPSEVGWRFELLSKLVEMPRPSNWDWPTDLRQVPAGSMCPCGSHRQFGLCCGR